MHATNKHTHARNFGALAKQTVLVGRPLFLCRPVLKAAPKAGLDCASASFDLYARHGRQRAAWVNAMRFLLKYSPLHGFIEPTATVVCVCVCLWFYFVKFIIIICSIRI